MKPPCFDTEEQYQEWVVASQDPSLAHINKRNPPTYCTDCLPDYQTRMKGEGRCAHPCTIFIHCGGPEAFYGKRVKG